LRSFERDELEEWEGINLLNKEDSGTYLHNFEKGIPGHRPLVSTSLSVKVVLRHLRTKFGVLAKKPIPKGILLCFFNGELVNDHVFVHKLVLMLFWTISIKSTFWAIIVS
jgi:hypothetical protein